MAMWGILVLMIAIYSAYGYQQLAKDNLFHSGKTINLDGMRGLLCVIMYVCHAESWRQFMIEGVWRTASNPFYILPGQSGIIIFFMITGYLFTSKFLKSSDINLRQLFIGRILRLYPAYILMYIMLLVIIKSNIESDDLLGSCKISHFVDWFFFTINGNPNICNFQLTNIIVAGVTWSIAFEWGFYCFMPVLAALLGSNIKLYWIISSIISTLIIVVVLPGYYLVYFMMFSGVMTACIEHFFSLPKILRSNLFSIVSIIIFILNFLINNETSYTVSSIVLLTLVFLVLASGNTFFGTLTSKPLQIFGIGTYGIYLYHGIILFVSLNTADRIWNNFYLNEYFFWLIIAAITPILILVSILSFIYFEHPILNQTTKVSNFLFSKNENTI